MIVAVVCREPFHLCSYDYSNTGCARIVIMNDQPVFEVSDAIAVINQSLDYAFPVICVVGEVSGFKINQGKWVFFDLKDDGGTLNCFMSKFSLRVPIEDGMKIMVVARAQLTQWGKFSLTVQQIKPVGEGSLKKAFELLRLKLDKEGLFAPERKRVLSELPECVGVISSVDAAGYQDFVKILNARYGGLKVQVYHSQVQGLDAPEQVMAGLDYFNELATPPEVILILRGGGSADDLSAFNDEQLVRKIAGSRVPVLTGIGHEVDVTLADLVADVRASTPSNAAEILVPDRRELVGSVEERGKSLLSVFRSDLERVEQDVEHKIYSIRQRIENIFTAVESRFQMLQNHLESLNPELVLKRGYAIIRDENGRACVRLSVGQNVSVETSLQMVLAEVKEVKEK